MTTPVDILGLTCAGLESAAAIALPSGAGVARLIYRDAMAGRFAPERHCRDPASVAAWRQHFAVGLLPVAKTVEDGAEPSSVTAADTAKAVFATHDGYEVEAVRIPMRYDEAGVPTSWTLCISSQVGCKMGCAFCETGRMGLLRHLTAGEIVSQVVTARAVLGWDIRNIVFMGMGEALDNTDAVIQAITILTGKPGLQYSFERITVCTSGHAEGLARLHAMGWKRLNLSISLNATTDEARDRLMPVNRRTNLAALQRILADFPQRANFTLGVNYCLMPGLNDSREDVARIADFCRPLGRVMVNLIPYNPGTAPLTRAPSEDEIVQWVGWLRDAGLPVRRRMTKGRSIMAACGQLGNVALRRQRIPSAPPGTPSARHPGAVETERDVAG
jgi:23S rRNA (adenine2503-C2)-methyltransferase